MKSTDLYNICVEYEEFLDEKKVKFLKSIKVKIKKNKQLSTNQFIYLQNCYDIAVSKKFGIENNCVQAYNRVL